MNLVLVTSPVLEPVSVPEALSHMRIILDQELLEVKHNLDAVTDPGAGDDVDDGYAVGSVWRNNQSDSWFKASVATSGAAVWDPLSVSAMDKTEIVSVHRFIRSSRIYAENYTHRAFVTQEWQLNYDSFPDSEIEIPKPPLISLDSVKYVDTDGILQTLVQDTDYEAVLGGETGKIRLVSGKSWPATKTTLNAVQIAFTAGYGASPVNVPENIRQAIRLLTGEHYERREEGIVGSEINPVILAAHNLLNQESVTRFC